MVFQRRLPNDLGQILAALAPHREELVGVVVESTFNWYWLVDGLMEAGYRVHLANTTAIKKYEGLKHSGDVETSEQVDALGFAPDVALALKANLAISAALQEQIEVLEKRLQRCVRLRHDYHLLKSVPGIGQTLATTIMLETGTVARFARVGNFSSYCRCVDSVRQSNGKKKGEGNTKNGNKYLAWAFAEAAHFAMRFCPEAKRFYERKKRKTNAIVATKALAHKLARACYHMLREQKPFDVQRCFV
jgi:transposase